MAEITVSATLTLTFDTEDGLVSTPEDAVEEIEDYILSGPSLGEFTIKVG